MFKLAQASPPGVWNPCATGSVFAFAGLRDRWRDPKNNVLKICTILTTRPNSFVAEVQDRMPAIGSERLWTLVRPRHHQLRQFWIV